MVLSSPLPEGAEEYRESASRKFILRVLRLALLLVVFFIVFIRLL